LRANKISEAQEHFDYLHEPNETLLGLSRGKPQGKGIGKTDTKNIFKSLKDSIAVKTGLVERFEDSRIFVEGIGKDKLSDMTTNIIRKHLINYTQEQCKLWNITMRTNVLSGCYWNVIDRKWESEYTEMLLIKNKKILLVPKSIVSFSEGYTEQEYTQHFVLNFLQSEHLKLNSALVQVRKNGEKYVTKKSIREDIGQITKDFLATFTNRHPEIFKNFKLQKAKETKCMSNEQIIEICTDESNRIGEITNHLIEILKEIKAGNEEANRYHRTVAGILELLFYPYLSNPIIENEIHEGRKRIDLTFTNNAEKLFFYNLPTIYHIPSSFIFVECKNHSGEIANQELDQIAGRFSTNRGKFGFIVCREINNIDRFYSRCSDTYKDDRGLVIPLTDTDLIEMLDGYVEEGFQKCNELLVAKFTKIGIK
jgi:hypothetical protein